MSFLNSLSGRVLLALLLGLGLGAFIQLSAADLPWLVSTADAVGGIWLGGLQMTVIPLVLALLVVGVAAVSDALSAGRLTARAIGWFVGLLVVTITITLIAYPLILSLWPVDAASAAALIVGSTGADAPATPQPIEFGVWLRSLAPTNPVTAAAENAILPLVIFALFFAFAITRLAEAQRTLLVSFFDAVADAMIVIVNWVLKVAPIGVFALALTLGLRGGLGSTGALLHYVILVSSGCILVALAAYPLATIFGRVPLGQFARAVAPAQVVAFSTQSSLGTLPVMVERAVDYLHIPERVAGLVLPLAVAIFRMTSPVANLGVVFFICHVSGIQPSVGQLIAAGVVAFAVSISSVGLPGQVSFFVSISPICLAMGAPIELLPLLLAVEVIPDIFRTVGNVSADLAVTAILNRGEQAIAPDDA
ncbi:MAG TPA: cation:dicarboxylase symporter family transporter [Brevundimonas sp.]|uniref:dicarboxylate/amino acid:cation symporter n=1 Tax=Brevundimonas sp. TaxID=1871086 RepID=UPI002B50BF9F|nr:cation:dicarboxylase symporter family transporter [Brevundimonas sp.]HRH21038.1 cation:dicarboxylase symporter family transporter [Brevundimonas sp.]